MNRDKMLTAGAKYGDRCEEGAVDAWLSMISTVSNLPGIEKITKLNSIINHYIYYYSDLIVGDDYEWLSPLSVLSTEYGDSNGLATVKFISLLELGFSEQQVRLHRVKVIANDDEYVHTVVGIHLDDSEDPIILDSITDNVELLSNRTDLQPMFAFNKTNVWIDNQLTDNDAKTYVLGWGKYVDLINEELY